MNLFVTLHILISLVAIGAGVLAVRDLVAGKLEPRAMAAFLWLTLLTSLTGLPIPPFLPAPSPAQIVAVIATVIMLATLYALYIKNRAGVWRTVFVVGAVVSLYFNVFVLVVQMFDKMPQMKAVAPGGGGPVFGAVQGIVLLLFVYLGWRAVKASRGLFAS